MKKKPTRKPTKKEALEASFELPKAPARVRVDDKAARELELRARPAAVGASSKLRRVESGVRLTAYIPAEMHRKLRVLCAEENRSMSDAATEAFGEWLVRKGAEPRGT